MAPTRRTQLYKRKETMTLFSRSSLLVLRAVLTLALLASRIVVVSAWENHDAFQEYPANARGVEATKTKELAPLAPSVLVLGMLPGRQDLLVHLEPLILRNAALFRIELGYIVQKGCDYDTLFDALTILQPHCEDHCLHQGRYCPIHGPEKLKRMAPSVSGSDIVLESLRRGCLATLLMGRDDDLTQVSSSYNPQLFFRYLKSFHDRDCLHEGYLSQDENNSTEWTTSDCTSRILQEELFIENPTLQREMENCEGVSHRDPNADTTNEALEKALAYNTIEDTSRLPLFEMNGDIVQEHTVSTAEALKVWCDSFGEHPNQPMACQFCSKCSDVTECLWSLECDGAEFDIQSYNQTDPPTFAPTTEGTMELITTEEEEEEEELEEEEDVLSDYSPNAQAYPPTTTTKNSQTQGYTITITNKDILFLEILGLGMLLGGVVVGIFWLGHCWKQKQKEQHDDAMKLLSDGFHEDASGTNRSMELPVFH